VQPRHSWPSRHSHEGPETALPGHPRPSKRIPQPFWIAPTSSILEITSIMAGLENLEIHSKVCGSAEDEERRKQRANSGSPTLCAGSKLKKAIQYPGVFNRTRSQCEKEPFDPKRHADHLPETLGYLNILEQAVRELRRCSKMLPPPCFSSILVSRSRDGLQIPGMIHYRRLKNS
jgi:hypothetical protein